MALLLPLLEWLVPMIAIALCALAYAFGAAITNTLKTGWDLLDNTIQWLTNRAVDFAIEFTKWIAPYFIEAVDRQVKHLHQLGQLSHYAAHFAWRTATTFYTWNAWLLHSYLPKQLGLHSDTTVAKVKAAGRTVPLSKAQVQQIESTIEWDIQKFQSAAIPTTVPLHWPKINWSVKKWRAWLGAGAAAGALTLPGSTAWDRAKWREQGKTNAKNTHRFRTLNWLLAFTGAAGLVAAGLAKLGLGWMSKCKNLKHIGPAFCGANLAGLIALFGALIVIEEGLSIEDFANAMLKIEGPVVDGIMDGITEFKGLTV